jgi:hypothetical protein
VGLPRRLPLCSCAALAAAIVAIAAAAAGCGSSGGSGAPGGSSAIGLPLDERPVPVGRGATYRISAIPAAVARRARVANLRCSTAHGPHYGVHVELYAHRLVVPVPAGIGVAPPQRRSGAYVLGGSCLYAIRTFEPTGVVVVDRGRTLSLGTLFAIWGQPLSDNTLAGFHGRVLAFVGGRRWLRLPAAIPLRRHAEIVLEVAGFVPPHPAYRFPPGL